MLFVGYPLCMGSAQQRQVVLNVGVLGSDLGIGAVLDQLRHGALDGLAQLCVIGAEGDAVLLSAQALIQDREAGVLGGIGNGHGQDY